jgi:glycosyltransferase involved in cell wall biosynthesis
MEQLPAYLMAFDVCLVPFKPGPLSAAVDPIKVYEYLAGGKPVVAANLPEVQGRPGVWHTQGKQEFVKAIEEALDCPPDSEALRAYARQNTWRQRAEQLLQGLGFAL